MQHGWIDAGVTPGGGRQIEGILVHDIADEAVAKNRVEVSVLFVLPVVVSHAVHISDASWYRVIGIIMK